MFVRGSPVFETGSEKYARLNVTVTVAIDEFSLHRVYYRAYAIE